MTDRTRRKELKAQYMQSRPEAGVYRIVNLMNGKYLLGSTPNLTSVRNKLAFAKSVDSLGAPDRHTAEAPDWLGTWLGGYRGATGGDRRLSEDIAQFGVEAFAFEVLEVLEVRQEMTREQITADLVALEELWREKLDATQLY